jgi:hypothetical protein
MEQLYNYVFHYNHFDGLWYAIPRENYSKYWDNEGAEGVLNAKDIDILIHHIIRK